MRPVRLHRPLGSSDPAIDHEELVVQTGERSGATMAIAIHSTPLGPALGGARLWRYRRDEDGIADALRLARGMTFKAAAAGLDLGGGKGVICAPRPSRRDGGLHRAALLGLRRPRRVARRPVHHRRGRRHLARGHGGDRIPHRHVTGMPAEHGGAGDPSPFTAIGVQAAMRAAC